MRTEECICINYAIGFHDADMIIMGSLCCSGLCATCAQTFLSCNYITLVPDNDISYHYNGLLLNVSRDCKN